MKCILAFDNVHAQDHALMLMRDFGVKCHIVPTKKMLFQKQEFMIEVDEQTKSRAEYLLKKYDIAYSTQQDSKV